MATTTTITLNEAEHYEIAFALRQQIGNFSSEAAKYVPQRIGGEWSDMWVKYDAAGRIEERATKAEVDRLLERVSQLKALHDRIMQEHPGDDFFAQFADKS